MIYMINPKKQRFYWLILQQDLLGYWCVRKIYGGLNNNHKREIWIPYKNEHEAAIALTDIEYIRRQRGYIYSDVEDIRHFSLTPQTINEVLAS